MVWSRPKYTGDSTMTVSGPGHGPQRDLHGLGGAVGDEQVSRIRVDAAGGQMAQHFMLERGQAGAGRIGAQQTRFSRSRRCAMRARVSQGYHSGAALARCSGNGWAVSA